jgi:hypothetical protein
MRRLAALALALVGLVVGGCGDDDPPDDATVTACVGKSGARVERGRAQQTSRGDGPVPQGTRQLLTATWQDEASAIVFRADDANAAERAEEDLRRIVRAFNTAEDQIRRDGVFLTLLGPAKVPREDDATALADCLS